MNRSPLIDRFGLRSKTSKKLYASETHLGIEALEERRLLSGNDLLITTVDGYINGDSVLRYNEATRSPVPGSVATGSDNALYYATGVVAAPDGSYYVSTLFGQSSGAVLHFADSGQLLGVLGADVLQGPGTLKFGPNGNLYVADLTAGDIYQFDIATQELAGTQSLGSSFAPGGFAFATDGTNDLIVGSLGLQEVVRYHTNGDPPTTLIDANSGFGDIEPSALLALSNGNLLIADFNFGGEPNGHHQIIECDASTGAGATVFANFTTTLGSGQQLAEPAQPEAMMLDADGNLLVGLSPDHNGNGAVEELDITSGDYVATIASGIGTPSGLAYVPGLTVMSAVAADWPTAGPSALTLASDSYDQLHLYDTDTTDDAVAAQSSENVGEVQVTAPDNTANLFTIDSSVLNNFIPPGGISFEGGSGSATNTVSIEDSAGSNSYSLNGSQLTINGSPLVTMTNTQALSLDLGSGSLDLGGAAQAIGSFTLVSGRLDVTTSTALPAGASLTVGANAASIFGVQEAVQTPLTLSSNNAVVEALPAATANSPALVPLENAAAPVVPPQGPALVTYSKPVPAVRSALPAGRAADSPLNAASKSLWRNYPRPKGQAIVQSSDSAGYLAWWNFSASSSNSGGSTSETDKRTVALDAVLAQYGSP